MALIQKILAKLGNEPAALALLKTAAEECDALLQWRRSFTKEREALKEERNRLAETLQTEPNQENAANFIAAFVEAGGTRADAISEVDRLTYEPINKLIIFKLQEPLKDALRAIISALQLKQAEVVQKESALAHEIGIAESGHQNSPAYLAINEKITEAQRKLDMVTSGKLEATNYRSVLNFILEK